MSGSEAHGGVETVRLFAFALAMEQTLAWIYRTAAGLLDESETRDVLSRLAQAEDWHAGQLVRAFPELASAATDDDAPNAWTVSRVHKELIPELDVTRVDSLLSAAYRVECGGELFYKRWAEATRDETARELAEHMRQQECVHQRAVGEAYENTVGSPIASNAVATRPLEWPEVDV